MKATLGITCAFSFGGAIDLSMAMNVSILIMGVIAMNLSKLAAVRVWCGATLLWRPGRLAPPNESEASEETGLLARSDEGGSIPPLHTRSQALKRVTAPNNSFKPTSLRDAA